MDEAADQGMDQDTMEAEGNRLHGRDETASLASGDASLDASRDASGDASDEASLDGSIW